MLAKITGSGCPSLLSGSVCSAGSFAAPPNSQSWGDCPLSQLKQEPLPWCSSTRAFQHLTEQSPHHVPTFPKGIILFSLNFLRIPCHQTLFAPCESPKMLT